MDSLIIQLDIANKKANFTSSKSIGAYAQVAVRAYNFPSVPDVETLTAAIYSDAGTVLTVCGAFEEDDNTTGMYEATLNLSTDNCLAYFSGKPPNFSKDLTFVLSDGTGATTNLYCNTPVNVKNNPNAVPSSPVPVTTNFVRVSDLGWSEDIGSIGELRDVSETMTAKQVMRALITLVGDLKSKGVI